MNPHTHTPHIEDGALRMLKTLEALLTHDATAEEKLSRMEAQAAEYRKSRRDIQRRIYYYRAIIAPVRRVPIEVLAHIFGFLAPQDPKSILQVSHVCRTWNEATRFPELWSNIVVDADTRTSLQQVRLYLERSGERTIGVAFAQSTPNNWHNSTWSEVKPSSIRWSTLSLTLNDCEAASQEIIGLPPAPELQELSVTIRGQCTNPAHDGRFGFEPPYPEAMYSEAFTRSPLLRSVKLSTFVLPVPGPLFLDLTTLHITDTFSQLESPRQGSTPIQPGDLLALLEFCPCLEEFKFEAEASVTWFVRKARWAAVSGPNLSLPRLRRLHLNCHYVFAGLILAYLSSNDLDTASFLMHPRHESNQCKDFSAIAVHFLSKSANIRSLHIHAFSAFGTIASMVVGLRHLETLHLEYVQGIDAVIQVLIREELFGYFNKPTWLLPALTNVTIVAQPFNLVHENLVVFVKSRYCHNRLHGTPKRIEKFVVNQRDMIKGMPAGEIAEFERIERFGGRTWQTYQSDS